MAEVSEDMILEYIIKKGGVVKNVDLVRHFRKYLQVESATEKGRRSLNNILHVVLMQMGGLPWRVE